MDIRKIKFTDLSLDKQQKLQDLSESLKELACDKEGWCYKYYDQSYLGQAIYEDFVKYNESDKDYKTEDILVILTREPRLEIS